MRRLERLERRTEGELTALLRARPDVLVGRPPRTLADLAQRLDSGPSVAAALTRLTAPQLQLFVAATALGADVPLARLSEFVAADPREVLQQLADLDLLEVDGSTVHVERAVRQYVPDLLGVGTPFADLVETFPHRVLDRAARGLGLGRTTSKRAAVEALSAFYADPLGVRAHAGALPPEFVAALVDPDGAAGLAGFDDDLDDDDLDGLDDDAYEELVLARHFDPAWHQRRLAAVRAALELGLMLGEHEMWGGRAVMPAEVTLALRGPDYRMRFDPEPPAVSWLPVSRVDADAAAALTRFDAAATAVLDNVVATPLPTVQSGGVGRRELTRLAKTTGVDVVTVTVVLELAAAAGLLTLGRPVVVSDAFAAWRDDEPAARVVVLLRAWWEFPGRPGEQQDEDGKARRAFTLAPCSGCRTGRQRLVGVLRTEAGLGPDDLVAWVGWHAPAADAGDPPYAGHRAEAEMLGVLAQGAVTRVGAALRAGDEAALRRACSAALPESSTAATFGSDLTVYVAGSPSARVGQLLDSCAARESSGGAVTWRLSAASVRRALDGGAALDDLRVALRGIAVGGALPNAVEVLLDDVGRVWGRARVRDAAGVVVSDDEALLAQLLHDRKLAKLGLTAVAPTVLLATADGRAVLTALRAAGYLPAWDGEDTGAEASPVVVRRSGSTPRPRTTSVDPADLARRLLDPTFVAPEPTVTELAVERFAPHLAGDQAAVLAAAVDEQGPVEIVYESSTGGLTERVVRPSMMLGDRFWGWCELRSGDREFLFARILAVRGV